MATFCLSPTSRQDDATKSLVLANNCRSRRSRQNSLLTNFNAPSAIGRSHFQNDLNGLAIVITTITTQN